MSYISFLQAPRQPSPAWTTDAPRIPRVFPPLAPLHTIESPRPDTFGSTLPVPRVGRTCDDGGMPRSVAPGRATVVPPLLLQLPRTANIAAAACTSPGECKGRQETRFWHLLRVGFAVTKKADRRAQHSTASVLGAVSLQ